MRCPYCGAEIEKSTLKRAICMRCFHWVDIEEEAVSEPQKDKPSVGTDRIEYRIEQGEASVTAYRGMDERVVIAAKYGSYPVTGISERAFADCRHLKEVIIPDSVRRIGKEAFANCLYLESADLGAGVTRIEEGAFYHCVSLTRVICKVPPLCAAVSAFSGCYNLAADIKNRLCMGE